MRRLFINSSGLPLPEFLRMKTMLHSLLFRMGSRISLLALLLGLMHVQSTAQCGNQNFNPVTTPTLFSFGQSFKICSAGSVSLDEIEILLRNPVSGVSATMEIYSGATIDPGSQIYTQPISITTDGSLKAQIDVSGFSTNLLPGQDYTFFIRDAASLIEPRANYLDPYADGMGFLPLPIIANPLWDFWFTLSTSDPAPQCGNLDFNPVTTPTLFSFGQSFKICSSESVSLNEIEILLRNPVSGVSATVELYSGATIDPGSQIYTQPISITTDGNLKAQIDVSGFSTALLPGQEYTFFIRDAASLIEPRANYLDPYADGMGFLPLPTIANPLWDFWFNLTTSPATPPPPSAEDNALHFASNDYVLVSNPSEFNVGSSTDFTIQALVKSTYNSLVDRCIFSKMFDNSQGLSGVTGYQLWAIDGKLTLEWRKNGQYAPDFFQGTSIITDANCHHVAAVVSRSTNNVKLYVDGVLELDVTDSRISDDIDNTAPVYIGRDRIAVTGGKWWYGSLDEVAFFTSARTAGEVAKSANSALTGTEANLLGYWKFDAGVPGADNTDIIIAVDQTGGNNGTLYDFDLTGTLVVTNAPDGIPGSPPVIVSNWELSACALEKACAEQNNALHFSSSDYVLVANPNQFDVGSNTDFTIQAVVKSTYNVPGDRCIFSKMFDNSQGLSGITGYQLWAIGGKLTLEWRKNGQYNPNFFQGTSNILDANCHHVAAVVSRSTNNVKLYVDGVLELDLTDSRISDDIDNTAPVYIGRDRIASTAGKWWYGSLDEVAFFTTARTTTEIERSAQFALSGTEAGLLGYWKFDSGVDGADNTGITNAIDETGGNNGTLIDFDLTGTQIVTNAPNGVPGSPPVIVSNWEAAPCGLISTCEERPDHALDFAQDDYVLVDNPNQFDVGSSTDFTIEALVKSTYNSPVDRCFFSKMFDNSQGLSGITGYQLWARDGKLSLEWRKNGQYVPDFFKGTSIITDGNCHHVAAVVSRSTNNVKLYVDGVLELDLTDSRISDDIDNTAPVYIGRDRIAVTGGNWWYGSLDDVAFFTTTRTAGEIQASSIAAREGASHEGTEPGLIGYWRFDSGVPGADNTGVTTALDETGGNNGTLIDFDLTGTQVVTNAPDGVPGSSNQIVSNWIETPCAGPNPADLPVIDPIADVVVQGCDGTVVFYDVSALVTSPTPVTITYNPAQFSSFDLGSTEVTVTATNAAGATTATFNVIVEDNVDPTFTLIGDNPIILCQGESFVDPLGIPDDNCALDDFQPSGSVDVNTPGTYTVTYTVTDVSGNTATAARTVIVKPLPVALEQDNCPNNNPSCGFIRVLVCPYQFAPDLEAEGMANAAYVAGASLNWYAFNGANNPPGTQLSGPPAINMENPASSTNTWVTQTVDGCESAPTRMLVRVKADRDPGLTLDFTGISLPTCGGATIDFLQAVSGFSSNVVGFRFYEGKPNQGGTLLTSTSGTTVANVNDPYFYAPVSNGTNTYYVQSIMSNANQCGGEASDDLTLSSAQATIIDVSTFVDGNAGPTLTTNGASVTVNHGQDVRLVYNGLNITNTAWRFIGGSGGGTIIFKSFTSNSITVDANNTSTTASTETIRAWVYNGNCAGDQIDIDIIINPCPTCRSAQENLRSYNLSAQQLSNMDVAINWDVHFDQEIASFDIERERADKQYEKIGQQTAAGNGGYQFIDRSALQELNRYRIKIMFADGGALFTEPVEVKANLFANPKRFAIYPNPTTDRFHVKALFPMEKTLTWQLTDMMGRVVKAGKMNNQEISIDLSSLPEGVYRLISRSEKGLVQTSQIIKN